MSNSLVQTKEQQAKEYAKCWCDPDIRRANESSFIAGFGSCERTIVKDLKQKLVFREDEIGTYSRISQKNIVKIKELEQELAESQKIIKEQESVIAEVALRFNQTELHRIVKEQDLTNRFFKSVQVKDSGCHEWQGSVSDNGYGMISIGNLPHPAHRVAKAISMPLFYDFYIVDHECKNRKCVNPEHLRCVGSRINSIENSTSISARNAAKTHCKSGHPLFGDNVRLRRNHNGTGFTRLCKACVQNQRQLNKERKRAREFMKKHEVKA